VDAFLLFCALSDSPYFPGKGFCAESAENFSTVVKHGRKPGLVLKRGGQEISMQAYAQDLMESIADCASQLDFALGDDRYQKSFKVQLEKLSNPELTPSAQLLDRLKTEKRSFHELALRQSQQHVESLRASGLTSDENQIARQEAQLSIDQQQKIEQSDSVSFDEYVRQFHAALKRPTEG
jgi:glutamate--cysteine ligase